MLTLRKLAFLVGLIFFLVIVVFRHSPKSPSIIRNSASHVEEVETEPSPAGKSKEEIEWILQQEYRPPRFADEFDSLRDHLAYLFPYHGPAATRFPAYIWQTWKYTPAMGEFDERFRITEASWTERHPDYVHEVLPPSRR